LRKHDADFASRPLSMAIGQWYHLQWLLDNSSCTIWRTMEKDEENHC
jgi:hypothetical protein